MTVKRGQELVALATAALLLASCSSSTPAADSPDSAQPASSVAESSASATPVVCWDETMEAQVSSCPVLSGPAAMQWVFRHSPGGPCSKPTAGRGKRITESKCDVFGISGRSVRVHFTEWSSFDAAVAEYDGQPQGKGELPTVWRDGPSWVLDPRDTPWRFKVALLYADAPWSLTIYAHDRNDFGEIHDELNLRPAAEVKAAHER